MNHLASHVTSAMNIVGALITSSILISSCAAGSDDSLRSGVWRGEFQIGVEKVPVNFEVDVDSSGGYNLYFINGAERAQYKSNLQQGDSIVVPIDDFDSRLILIPKGSTLTGQYKKNSTDDKGISLTAELGDSPRFITASSNPLTDITGTWDVDVIQGAKEPNKTVGVFEQKDGKITGTLMSVTGDYRYFEGVIDGSEIYLSAFSGSSPKLIKGRLSNPSAFEAELISANGRVKLIGKKNDQAKLPDPYTLTYLKDPAAKFDFTFPDPTGKNISLHDEKYKGKVVIVTLTGSWCPNCMDEAAFLAPWYKANASRGVEIIGLSFETKDDLEFARGKIARFKNRYGVTYDILFAGLANREDTAKKLPQINEVISFPTTFFIDRAGVVRKIHTGFSGPATGKYYDQFLEEFEKEVNGLLAEAPSI